MSAVSNGFSYPETQRGMRVFVVESGDYEQRGVFLVAISVEAAVAAVKAVYGDPYVVEWDDVRDTSWTADGRKYERWTLTGRFTQVLGYSAKHEADFDITPYPLAGAPQ